MLAAFLRALFFTFYRCRVARKQYFCVLSSPCSAGTIFLRFIVTVQRGNNIFAILSSPCSAGTISLPFYRRRAARKRYFCHFIVAVQRGNNIFAILSSPCSAETIFCHFIVTAQRSCKCICYASEKRADYPVKRQTNTA